MPKTVQIDLIVRDERAGDLMDQVCQQIEALIEIGEIPDCAIAQTRIKGVSAKTLAGLTTDEKEAVNVPTNLTE